MRLYVIGPVTGREGLNRAAFEAAKDELWGAGYDVLIPHDVVPSNATYSVAMRLSIKTLLGCDGVALLIDWDESTGATLEKRVAEVCGIETHYVRAWLRLADDCPENDNFPRKPQTRHPTARERPQTRFWARSPAAWTRRTRFCGRSTTRLEQASR